MPRPVATPDPRFGTHDSIVRDILSDERIRQNQSAINLIRDNQKLGCPESNFAYGGFTYGPYDRVPDLANAGYLDPSLEERAEIHHNNFEKILADEAKIRSILKAFSIRFPDAHKLRDALPEELVTSLSTFDGMKRRQPQEAVLALAPHLKAQSDILLDIFHYYRAMNLVLP